MSILKKVQPQSINIKPQVLNLSPEFISITEKGVVTVAEDNNLDDALASPINAADKTIGKEQQETDQITLIYKVEEVNEKYLNKNKVEEATLETKTPSSFRKLLAKVYDLKNNQDPLGELRQKKDEILALSFKKNRSEN